MHLYLEGNNTVPINNRNRGKRQCCGIKPNGERCKRHYYKGHEVGERGIFLCWQHHDVLLRRKMIQITPKSYDEADAYHNNDDNNDYVPREIYEDLMSKFSQSENQNRQIKEFLLSFVNGNIASAQV